MVGKDQEMERFELLSGDFLFKERGFGRPELAVVSNCVHFLPRNLLAIALHAVAMKFA